MDVKELRKIIKQYKDFKPVEITYTSETGLTIVRTCYLNPHDRGLFFDSFEQIPEDYRKSYRERYKYLPCLEVSSSLDRNWTFYGQPMIQLLPEEINDIKALSHYNQGMPNPNFSNAVEIRTEDPVVHYQTVLGFLLNDKDLERIVKRNIPAEIDIARFKENDIPQEITTIKPMRYIFLLVYE